MAKSDKVSITKLADKMAGTEGVKFKDRTPFERAAWRVQKALSVQGGGYVSLTPRAVKEFARMADELARTKAALKNLQEQVAISRAYEDMFGDGDMKLGVPKPGM